MLTAADRDLVTEYLLGVASQQPNAKLFLLGGLEPELQFDFADGTPRDLVNRAIELCLNDGYQRRPPALAGLLRRLLGVYPDIEEIAARISVPPPMPPDPFNAVVLDTKLPFLGREPARSLLRAWKGEPVLRQVVVINGGPKRGKSYTAEFIDHLVNHLSSVKHCLVELAPQQGASTGALELARDMVARMGGDPTKAPPAHTNADRWAEELSNWVMSVAAGGAMRWWFVLDGFNNRELRDDTGKFIIALSKVLVTGVHKGRHCMVLLDFDRTLLKLAPGKIGVETLADIPAAAVTAFVASVVNGSGLDATTIGAKVLEGLGDPIADVAELGQRLGNLVDVL